MKYNLDCIRAVLLELEEQIKIEPSGKYEFVHTSICIFDLLNELSREEIINPFTNDKTTVKPSSAKNASELFDTGDIVYSVEKLEEAGYIKTYTDPDGIVFIITITFSGHEFLETIKPLDKWETVKSTVKSIGCAALSVVGEIAKSDVMIKLGLG